MNGNVAEKIEFAGNTQAWPEACDRIKRLRRKYQTGPAYISIERARYFTESWKATEGKGVSKTLRVALAMKNVYEKMTHYLDPDDRIAGYWCEYFLGIPIDIERGVFNSVLEAELNKRTMLKFRAGTMVNALGYMVRKGKLGEFIKNQRIARSAGTPPLNMSLKTMPEREINPYRIEPEDERCLLGHLLPYWKGRCVVDIIEKELLDTGLFSKEMYDFVLAVPGNTSRQVFLLSTCASIAAYLAHVILDYDNVLEKGLEGMKAEVAEKLQSPGLTEEGRDFLESMSVSLDGVEIFARRIADKIEQEILIEKDAERKKVLGKMLDTCRRVPFKPAETFEEAVQSIWTVKTAVETAHPVYLNCFGRLDQNLYPYYKRDIENGKITRDEARELVEELLLKIMSQNIRPESNILGNFYHRYLGSSPVTLGGVTPDGKDATNELTYLFVEAAHNSKAITNVSVRIHEKTPDELLFKVAGCLHEGTSSFSLFSDEINIDAMERRGFTLEDSRDYAVMGCVETACPGKTGSMSANALLLTQLLDMTMRNGDSKILAGTIKGDGPQTGDPDSFESFDRFVDALIEQTKFAIKKIVDGSNLRDRFFAEHLPSPVLSSFIDGCLENAADITAGGATYDLAGISFINSIANLVDSLLTIRELIFKEKRLTFKELIDIVDNNFMENEDIYKKIKDIEGKWGNGNPETDKFAHDLMKRMFEDTYKYKAYRGGPFVVYVISMITHTIDGRISIASPDGRKTATPYAASCNPYNVERSGVTAALRSVAALPFEDVMGAAVNMKFHPSGIGDNPQAMAKWVSLIRTYFKLGGTQVQPTVASAQMLKAAQRDPEQYRDLIVKVGGYSTYFVDLGREIQEEIIARTEHV